MKNSNTSAKIATVFYVIWGVLHLLAARAVYLMGQSLSSSMVQGRVFQDAWNLLFFAIVAIGVAVTLNWRNNVWGYWINFATVGVADTGFIFFVVLPGHVQIWPGILGPAFWILGLIFSTIALVSQRDSAGSSFTDSNATLNQPR